MDEIDLIRRRLQRQRLTSAPLSSAVEVVSLLGAVQAQEYGEARWSLAERMRGEPTAEAVDAAFDSGEILRAHVLRPTWHFVARDDIRWILTATAERVHAANKGPYRQHHLSPELIARSNDAIAALLADREPRTRKELQAALAEAGIEAEGSRLAHIVMWAELDALICSGPLRGKQHTYALISDRAPNAPDLPREEALVELARRYFAGHGPASRRDFCVWASLTRAEADPAIAALGDDLKIADDPDLGELIGPAARLPRRTRNPEEALLVPMYDEAILGYSDVRPTTSGVELPVGHFERPIVIDGETVGTWRRITTSKRLTVEVTPIAGRLEASAKRAIEVAADRLGRHLGLAADATFVQPSS